MLLDEISKSFYAKLRQVTKDTYISEIKKGERVFLNTYGGSMYPLIKSGDKIKVALVSEDHLRIGDIAVVDNNMSNERWFFAHRIIEIIKTKKGNMYKTKGDSQKNDTAVIVPFEKIIGKIILINRKNLILINFENWLPKFLNFSIGVVSLRISWFLPSYTFWINVLIEWKQLPFKIMRKLKGFRVK